MLRILGADGRPHAASFPALLKREGKWPTPSAPRPSGPSSRNPKPAIINETGSLGGESFSPLKRRLWRPGPGEPLLADRLYGVWGDGGNVLASLSPGGWALGHQLRWRLPFIPPKNNKNYR